VNQNVLDVLASRVQQHASQLSADFICPLPALVSKAGAINRKNTERCGACPTGREDATPRQNLIFHVQKRRAALQVCRFCEPPRSKRSSMPRKSGRGGPLRRAAPRRAPGRRARGRRRRSSDSNNDARATDLVARSVAPDAHVTDLVERLDGLERRLGDRTLSVEGNAPVQEWKLRVGIQQLLQMLHPETTLDVADRLLRFLVDGDESALRVVWFTDTHYVVCESLDSPEPTNNPHRFRWGVFLQCSGMRTNDLKLWGAVRGVRPEPELFRVLYRLVGLGTIVYMAGLEFRHLYNFDLFPPGVEDVVSLARSSRYVFCSRLTPETARALASNCNPLVRFSADLDTWDDQGAALIEEMVANRCPAKLQLSEIPDESVPSLAAAVAATTSLEELDLRVRSLSRGAAIFDAIGRNRSIRSLTVVTVSEEPLADANETEFLWESVSKSSSIKSIRK
jgi:hypothetical protein